MDASNGLKEIICRHELTVADKIQIEEIISSSGCFSETDIKIAIEVADEHLNKKEESGYSFILAESLGNVLGYICFGPIIGADKRFEIYWIAILNNFRNLGIGKKLLQEAERKIISTESRRIFVETSSKDAFQIAREFYKKNGYKKEAIIPDFYSDGDHKIIYSKRIK
ncbi:MAG: N-acetyltransferase [bacterium]